MQQCMVHLFLRRTMAVDQNHGVYQPEISTPQLLENTVTSQSPKMRAACPAVDKNTGQAHFGETIILLRIYLAGGLEHLDYVSLCFHNVTPDIYKHKFWDNNIWNIYVSIYWEFQHHCYSVHHFSEGLVAQPPTMARS